MARTNSPGYPNMSLPKALVAVRKIFDADRRNPIDRVTAAKHIGYAGASGASDKALASLAHYGLTEKTGKSEIRVSQLALDIIHPDKPQDAAGSIQQAGLKPAIFKQLRERFPGHVSEDSLRSYLIREGFQNIAIAPVMSAYFDTISFLQQNKAFDQSGAEANVSEEVSTPEGEGLIYGGAKVGDLVQWEVDGVLQMESPMRVRLVSDDGLWIAVDGSETGIPMEQVLVEERASSAATPPKFKLASKSDEEPSLSGEKEWMRSLVGRDIKVRLLVSGGDMGAKEIGKLMKLLEAQRAVLSDDEEDA
ncbi:MAG: hypothetical protein JOY99_01375 [Sphingomonadaceae bacterium]|nr:hypothetical protein [Sphingomonadaceae bacterium]